MENKLNQKDYELRQKINKEYRNFSNSIKNKSKGTIFNRAYEIVVKEEIINHLRDLNIYGERKQALLDTEDLLERLYQDWLRADLPLGEIVGFTVINSTWDILKQDKKSKNIERDI